MDARGRALCRMDIGSRARVRAGVRRDQRRGHWQIARRVPIYRGESIINPNRSPVAHRPAGSRRLHKVPKSKGEIQALIVAELRECEDCETARGVLVVAVDDAVANWTVAQFNRGESDAYACDRALQRIVPHYQRLYELVQKH